MRNVKSEVRRILSSPGLVVVVLPPAGGVRGQWAAAMAWIHLSGEVLERGTAAMAWILLHTHHHHHLKTLTTFQPFYSDDSTLHRAVHDTFQHGSFHHNLLTPHSTGTLYIILQL